MPLPPYQDVYHAYYTGPFVAAFGLSLLLAVVALVLDVLGRWPPARGVLACAALVVLTTTILASYLTITTHGDRVEAALATPTHSACSLERFRYWCGAEAHATAAIVLWAAPLPLVLATYIAARAFRRRAAALLAIPAVSLLCVVAQLFLRPIPGHRLWLARCELRDAGEYALSSDHDSVVRGCLRLIDTFADPKALAAALGTDTLDIAMPDWPRARKACLAFMLADQSFGRTDILSSPFVSVDDRATVDAARGDAGAAP